MNPNGNGNGSSLDNTSSGVSLRNVTFAEPPDPASNTNPIDPQLMGDATVASFWRSIQASYNTLAATTYAQLGQIDTDWRAQEHQLDAQADKFNQQYLAQQRAAIKSAALTRIGEAQRAAEQARDQIGQACDNALTPAAPRDPTAALLAQQQQRDAWERLKMRLNSAGGPNRDRTRVGSIVSQALADLVQKAARDGDTATVAAARYYASAYLAQFGATALDDVALGKLLDDAEAPSLPPVGRAANQVKEALRVGWPRLASAIGMARRMANDRSYPRVAELPGWDGTSTRISQWGL